MRRVQTTLALCILIRCCSAVMSSEETHSSKYKNLNTIQVGGYPRPTLQIPLDINIKTDSEFDRCQPSKSPYCFSVRNQTNQQPQQDLTKCPFNAPDHLCAKNLCTKEFEMLESFRTSVKFLIIRDVLQPIGQLPDGCRLAVGVSSLEFKGIVQPVDSHSECTLPKLQPSIGLNASSLGHTLMFNLQITEVPEPPQNP